ncbi:hypothetical protein CBR_g30797 [Chara braunii]|uniref:Cytochrome b5 heme-binding domain-containing protein n=1 Tax=Chara braunii TaxID=69332 RepID=A0A388JXF2_CHABU|nr:hypothetical protein CBR_g30797 [Chara braunii]|eukprot:GBG62476.1 hypothetical protein CBR_g30797 [Chara braunii]
MVDVSDLIVQYTGLSPLAFVAIVVGLLGALYLLLASKEAHAGHQHKRAGVAVAAAPKETIKLGDSVTEEELEQYDGSDPSKPLMLACKGVIYDVSSGRDFYGPGGPYDSFAGRYVCMDASRALAKMSSEPEDLTGNLDGLSLAELERLDTWAAKFDEKYPVAGRMKSATKEEEKSAVPENAHENGSS